MKKVLALVLCAFMFVCSACGRASESEPVTTTEPTAMEHTTEEHSTEAITEALTTTEPVTTDPLVTLPMDQWMTDAQAKILAADIEKRREELEHIFAGAGLPGKHEVVFIHPANDELRIFRVCENPLGIYSIAELKAFVEKTYTKEYAQKWFYAPFTFVIENPSSESCGRFFEKDDELFFQIGPYGIYTGYYPETTQVKSQTKDTLLLTMDFVDAGDSGKSTWQLKWQGGAWKLDEINHS